MSSFKEEPYDPSQISGPFISSMTVAGFLGCGTSMGDENGGKRIAVETVHEERLRRMMQKMCGDLRDSHFPNVKSSSITTQKRIKTKLSETKGVERNSLEIANIQAPSTAPAIFVSVEHEMSQENAIMYPSYNALSTSWTEAVLGEPHRYTEFLVRQALPTTISPKQSGGAKTTTLREGESLVQHSPSKSQKHNTNAVVDETEMLSNDGSVVPAMPVKDHHLPGNIRALRTGHPLSSLNSKPHSYTAPLLVDRQALPPISPFATLGKHTTGRRFYPVYPPDQRDHRVNQYTEEELEQFRLGERKMPDGPIVYDWRLPTDISLSVQEKKRRGVGDNHKTSPQTRMSLCDALRQELALLEHEQLTHETQTAKQQRILENERARVKGLNQDILSLQASLESARKGVESEASDIEQLKVREWEKLLVGDTYKDVTSVGEECLPLGSPLNAVRQQRRLSSPFRDGSLLQSEKQMIEQASMTHLGNEVLFFLL